MANYIMELTEEEKELIENFRNNKMVIYIMELTEEEKELIENFRNNKMVINKEKEDDKKVKELEEKIKNEYNWILESEGVATSIDGGEDFTFSDYINDKKWCVRIYSDGDIGIYETENITGETPKLSDEEKNIFKEIIKYKYFEEE